MYMAGLALKNIRRHPVQSILTVAGVALSVAVILASSIVNAALRDSFQRTVEELGTGKTDVWIYELSENNNSIGTRLEGFPQEIAATIGGLTSVASVHPSLRVFATASSDTPMEPKEIFLYGVDFSSDREVRRHVLTEGGYPTGPGQAMIGERLGALLKLSPGGKLTIQSARGPLSLTVSGLLSADQGTGGLHNNFIVFADLAVTQRYFGYEGRISTLEIIARDGESGAAGLTDALAPLVPPNAGITVDPIATISGGDSTAALRVSSFILSLISVMIAACIIYATLAAGVEGTRREIGLLRLVGMKRRQIRMYVNCQSLFFALSGSAGGIGLGILLGQGLVRLAGFVFAGQTIFAPAPSLSVVAIAACIGIIVTIAVGALPAMKAAKIPPLQFFRDDESPGAGTRWSARNTIGLGLLALGLALSVLAAILPGAAFFHLVTPLPILAGFCLLMDRLLLLALTALAAVFPRFLGLPGRLAVRSLILRLRRTAIAVGAIVVSVSIFIGYWGMTQSFKRTAGDWYDATRWADLLVFSTSGVEMDPSLLQRMTDLPYIRGLNPLRYQFIPYDHEGLSDRGFLFQGIDPDGFRSFTGLHVEEGNTETAIEELRTGRALLVNAGLAATLGLKAGDTIRLASPGGPLDLTIAGTVVDYSDFIHRMGKIVYGSYEILKKYWDVHGYTVIQARIAAGYTPQEAKEQLRALAAEFPIKVLTHAEERADVGSSIDRIFSIFYAINAMIFLIVFMSVFNTLLISVLAQIREFAILRAIGCRAKQIRSMVVCEAIAMSVIGVIFATLAGIFMAVEMVASARMMMKIQLQTFLPLGAALLLGGLTVLVALIATVYPRRVASGISISRVLQRVDEM
jgi:putative ABC transport system permease protein